MSIEVELKRIADALELLVTASGAKVAAPSIEPSKKTSAGKSAAKAPEQESSKTETIPAPTEGDVLKVLQLHANTFTSADTKALMIEHGADKTKPTVKSIPPANYSALIKKAEDTVKTKIKEPTPNGEIFA